MTVALTTRHVLSPPLWFSAEFKRTEAYHRRMQLLVRSSVCMRDNVENKFFYFLLMHLVRVLYIGRMKA